MSEINAAIKRTRDAYNRVALSYDAFTSHFHNLIAYPKFVAIVEHFVGDLAGKTILDLGCGSGSLVGMFNERGASACGIDISSTFVETAKSRNLRVAQASMHQLPFPDEAFDGVVSHYALNYLPHKGQSMSLQEQYRVLRPNGVVVFSYMHPFFMRMSRYQELSPHYSPVIENYFRPVRQESVEQLGQKFVLYLLDWPEIANMVMESGFILREFIDAETPKNLEEVSAGIGNEIAARFVRSFQYQPYAMFVVATK